MTREQTKVMALHPKCRVAEPPPHRKAQKACGEKCHEKWHAKRRQKRNRVGSNSDESTLCKRDLAGIAECQIEADRSNSEDSPGRNQENAIRLQKKQRGGWHGNRKDDGQGTKAGHAVRSSIRPSRPCGRSRMTAIRTINGNAPRYCHQIYAADKLSSTPRMTPRRIAPRP